MNPQGGTDILLEGRPAGAIEPLPEPDKLYLPLKSLYYTFSSLQVAEGDKVAYGQAVAVDEQHSNVPLLAPRSGRVRLDEAEGYVVLDELGSAPAAQPVTPETSSQEPGESSSAEDRQKRVDALVKLGAWSYFHDAFSNGPVDSSLSPEAIIVTTVRHEPFHCRGNVLLREGLAEFIKGLKQLQGLLEYQPIHLAMPDIQSPFANKVREALRGVAFVKVVQVEKCYPNHNFALLARRLGIPRSADRPVWGLRVAGVLAANRALTHSLPCVERVLAFGGPGVTYPCHLRAPTGYPVKQILGKSLATENPRVLSGGVLKGRVWTDSQLGLDIETDGITVLSEDVQRELLSFVRPGTDRRSYSKTFLSSFMGAFRERLDTALRGERRPCVSCGLCEDVCPAGIMPQLIHKLMYQDEVEEAENARMDLCVECGLCSYVCPSKIDLRQQIIDAKAALAELQAEETSE